MNSIAPAINPSTLNVAEKPVQEQMEEVSSKIVSLAIEPAKNSAELAQLAMKYAELEKLDTTQKTTEKKEAEAIGEEKTEEYKTEMKEATNKANQEKTMKMEELKNRLQDKPENAEKNAETIKDQAKNRLSQTIERYVNKIKEFKNSSEKEKKAKEKELQDMKDEIKKTKEEYETAKSFFLGKTNYKTEELAKISTRWIRFGKKEVKGGVVTRTLSERLQVSTIRRRMTENKLIEKFNKIGDKPTDGVRFIMGFEKDRFLRYTGINLYTSVDKAVSKRLQINDEQFHKQFNRGKTNLFAVLDKGEKTEEEQKVIDALKKRINYYGYAYGRQRASARTDPFIKADANAKEGQKIIAPNTGKLDMTEEQKKNLLKVNPN